MRNVPPPPSQAAKPPKNQLSHKKKRSISNMNRKERQQRQLLGAALDKNRAKIVECNNVIDAMYRMFDRMKAREPKAFEDEDIRKLSDGLDLDFKQAKAITNEIMTILDRPNRDLQGDFMVLDLKHMELESAYKRIMSALMFLARHIDECLKQRGQEPLKDKEGVFASVPKADKDTIPVFPEDAHVEPAPTVSFESDSFVKHAHDFGHFSHEESHADTSDSYSSSDSSSD